MSKISLLTTLLRCPICRHDFRFENGAFVCRNGHSFSYQNNIIDVSFAQKIGPIQQRSNDSFQTEWTQFYQNLGWRPHEFSYEKHMFLTYTRSMPNFFINKIVIDAGCGNGRYINVVIKISSPPPQLIIGVDLSDAVYTASRNCSVFNNVVFIKMDINSLPAILKTPVDYIYSIGVLHHTPDAEKAFYNLARRVKKDGFISMFLYGKGNPILYKTIIYLRNYLFQKLSHRAIYYLCVLVAIPCQIFRIKLFGPFILDLINRFIFISPNVHNMFDAYTAGWTSFHEKMKLNSGTKMQVSIVLLSLNSIIHLYTA
jgi:SAM-dependent methyltransferase